MSGNSRNNLLAKDIAVILHSNAARSAAAKGLLVTGVAIACLHATPARALTLQELQVKSALGEPLTAVAVARLGAGESLAPACITPTVNGESGLNSPQGLRVNVPKANRAGDYPITITSETALYEPMYEIRLQVSCPGTVSLARNYIVMLGLPMTSPQTQPEAPVNAVKKAQVT